MPPNEDTLNDLTRRLCERSCVLFLGAGINQGVVAADDEVFPLAQDLSRKICTELLDESDTILPLDEAAEIARHKLGNEYFNRFIYNIFTKFHYGSAHLIVSKLPWSAIYSTNYDTLIESAYQNNPSKGIPNIFPIHSIETDMNQLKETDLVYYKLHGCITSANTDSGRLILTKDDYRHYERHRKPMFKRLQSDIISNAILFIGYSLSDTNFRKLLDDCKEELGSKNLPRSYSVQHAYSDSQETFWSEKYNIQLIKSDGVVFLKNLIDSYNSTSIPKGDSYSSVINQLHAVDENTRFPIVAESFYHLVPSLCTGEANPQMFFKGKEPSWADIRDGVPAQRDRQTSLENSLLDDLVDTKRSISAYLVSGNAGSGKTTLIRSTAYKFARDLNAEFYFHIPNTPIDSRTLLSLPSPEKRRFIVFHDGAMIYDEICRFQENCKRDGLNLSIIIEGRTNLWQFSAQNSKHKLDVDEAKLNTLSDSEIDRILIALQRYECLGAIAPRPLEFQRSHFKRLSNNDLLVALRELTENNSFDNIIKNDYDQIPTRLGKLAVLFASAVGQIGIPLRYANLIRIIDVNWADLKRQVFLPTEEILYSGEVTGRSRNNSGFNVRIRHPRIASVIFDHYAPSDQEKVDIFKSLIGSCDPGFEEDRSLLNSIARNRKIFLSISNNQLRADIYESLRKALPGDPYIYQHSALLEKDSGNIDQALLFARKAIEIGGGRFIFKSTLSFIQVKQASLEKNEIKKDRILEIAIAVFKQGMNSQPENPYNYIGYCQALEEKLKITDKDSSTEIISEIISVLNHGYESTEESSEIASAMASCRKYFEDKELLESIATTAIKRSPTNPWLRDTLISLYIESGRKSDALNQAIEGISATPTAWRLYLHAARLLDEQSGNHSHICEHYEGAIRYNKNNLRLYSEYIYYLYRKGEYTKAVLVSKQARSSDVPHYLKKEIHRWWKVGGHRKFFDGRIKEMEGNTGIITAIPENFTVFFLRTSMGMNDLRVGDFAVFQMGFNALGPIAENIEKKSLQPKF